MSLVSRLKKIKSDLDDCQKLTGYDNPDWFNAFVTVAFRKNYGNEYVEHRYDTNGDEIHVYSTVLGSWIENSTLIEKQYPNIIFVQNDNWWGVRAFLFNQSKIIHSIHLAEDENSIIKGLIKYGYIPTSR